MLRALSIIILSCSRFAYFIASSVAVGIFCIILTPSTSKAQLKANAKYREKLDDIKVRVPKGKREVYKAHAERKGKSLNALIIELLEKDMQEED